MVERFVKKNNLRLRPELDVFSEEFALTNAGIAEVVVPPGSSVIGKCPRDLLLRKTTGLTLACKVFASSTARRPGGRHFLKIGNQEIGCGFQIARSAITIASGTSGAQCEICPGTRTCTLAKATFHLGHLQYVYQFSAPGAQTLGPGGPGGRGIDPARD